MKKGFRVLLAGLLVGGACLAAGIGAPVLAGSYPYGVADTEIAGALGYLRGEQSATGSIGGFASSAWVTMAVKAAGEDPHDWQVGSNPSLVDYLEESAGDADLPADYARMLLAIAATEEDPASFGGRDFVALMKASYTGGQLGDSSLLNDDFWGVLGLIAAGESVDATEVSGSLDFILDNQNSDGGWSWGVGADSDVDDTAAAIMALVASGESPSSSAIVDGLGYLKSMQLAAGGFESWGSSNADTDSWSICALAAALEDPDSAGWTSGSGQTPVSDLLSFQQTGGAFHWQAGNPGMSATTSTAAAIIALIGETFPVATLAPVEGGVSVRVEGAADTVWSGQVTVDGSDITATNSGVAYHFAEPTAIGALDEAASLGGFSYETSDEWGSLYVTTVAGEEPVGMSGWMYRIDGVSPQVGAADFVLDETSPPEPPHAEVLFYYGEWDLLPLKLAVSDSQPGSGEEFTVTVSYFDDDAGDWLPADGATVYAGTSYTTGADGTVDITVNSDMTLSVYAEQDGFIRSNRVAVTVGTGTGGASQVSLAADIMPAVAINVTPNSVDFGDLGPRDASPPYNITITNVGAWDVTVTCDVSDDAAAGLFSDGLEVNDVPWDDFSHFVDRGANVVCTAALTVPENYAGVGEKKGTLIFWAAEAVTP